MSSQELSMTVNQLLEAYNKYETIRKNNLKATKKYQKTEKGKLSKKRYNQKYFKTEAGRLAQRKANRRYRERLKMEKFQNQQVSVV